MTKSLDTTHLSNHNHPQCVTHSTNLAFATAVAHEAASSANLVGIFLVAHRALIAQGTEHEVFRGDAVPREHLAGTAVHVASQKKEVEVFGCCGDQFCSFENMILTLIAKTLENNKNNPMCLTSSFN